jgi:hypothetical protein
MSTSETKSSKPIPNGMMEHLPSLLYYAFKEWDSDASFPQPSGKITEIMSIVESHSLQDTLCETMNMSIKEALDALGQPLNSHIAAQKLEALTQLAYDSGLLLTLESDSKFYEFRPANSNSQDSTHRWQLQFYGTKDDIMSIDDIANVSVQSDASNSEEPERISILNIESISVEAAK